MSNPTYTITGITSTGFPRVLVSDSHESSTSTASIECLSHDLEIGDYIEVAIGYDGTNTKKFSGYVKQIERKIPEDTYTITANNLMLRAIDTFLVASDPKLPFTRNHIDAEDLIGDLMEEAGLTEFDFTTSYLELYTSQENGIEVNLVAVYEYCKGIAAILAWGLWCDTDGVIHLHNRKPYPMTGDSGQVGDVADVPLAYTWSDTNVLNGNYLVSEKDLRNRVVVYGAGVQATADAVSPYLPDGFYKTVLIGATNLLSTQSGVDRTAAENLTLLNRLTYEFQVTVVGNPILEARKVITVNSTQFGLSGNWYIFSCEHSMDSGGYITTMKLRK